MEVQKDRRACRRTALCALLAPPVGIESGRSARDKLCDRRATVLQLHSAAFVSSTRSTTRVSPRQTGEDVTRGSRSALETDMAHNPIRKRCSRTPRV